MSGIFRYFHNLLISAFVSLLKAWNAVSSSLFGERCRFYPSCSRYTAEALEKHGLLYGGFLGAKRLCSCHPFSEGGLDFVPDKSITRRHS